MSLGGENFEEVCEMDGEVSYVYNNAGCVAPEVFCPATGACLSQYDPNFDDLCELVLARASYGKKTHSATDVNYFVLIPATVGGFLFGVFAYLTVNRYCKQPSSKQENLLMEHV